MTSINRQLEKNDDWPPAYLIDIIFNNLMDDGYNGNRGQNKYINQMVRKFNLFRIRSPSTYFEIDKNDLDAQIIKQIEDCVRGCRTPREKYLRLNGIFVQVISRIAKQAEPIILSQMVNEDIVWIKVSLNEIRELVSFKWKLIGGK